MSKLLFNEQPLVVDKELAALIGLNEAIVLQQIHYWLQINENTNKNHYDGRYWTYNTINEWTEEFHFWSYETVKRILSKLRKLGIIITENYNKIKMDRTLWYSIDYNLLEELYEEKIRKENKEKINKKTSKVVDKSDFVQKTQCIRAKCSNETGQNDLNQKVKMLSPIPEISTETNKDISQSVSQQNRLNDETYFNPYTNQNMTCDKLYKYITEEVESMGYVYPYSEILQNSVRDIFYSERKIKSNDKYLRREYAVKLCNIEIIDFAIKKFKIVDIENIKNPHGYFTTILYTSIFEYSANEAVLNADIEKKYS